MFECHYAKKLWEHVENSTSNVGCNWDMTYKLLNNVQEKIGHVINLIVLIVKRLIFQQKCLNSKPTIDKLDKEIKFYYLYERQLAKGDTKALAKFKKKWEPVLQMIT